MKLKRLARCITRTTAVLSASSLLMISIANADTGGLRVKITDAAGNPVSGATVVAATPDSLTEKTAVTDAQGEVRLIGLDPSDDYAVTVSGPGFQPLRNEDVQVVSGRSFSLTYAVTASQAIEELVVVGGGRGALVDTTSATVSTAITLDMTEALPTGRSYQSYLQLAPSTKPTLNGNPASKSGVNYSDAVDSNGNTAGNSTDNVYYIDGVNITDNLTGTFGANFNSEIIQEQQIVTGGVPAEYEGGQGLISRVVTKSGSNEFHGSFNYYMQSDSLVADNEHLADSTFSTFDSAFTIGGPILQDKLWFFGSMQRKEREEDVVNPNTSMVMRSVNTEQDLGFLKLTYQPTDNDTVVLEYFDDPYERDGSDDYTILANRDSSRIQGGENYKASYSHAMDNLIVTLDATRHTGEASATSTDTTSRNDVAYFGTTVTNAQLSLGGRGSDTIDFRNKESWGVTAEYFLDTPWGSHEIKGGFSRIENERKYDLVYTGDGAQYTSIGTFNSGATLNSYVNNVWQGERDVSSDDFARIISAMAASTDAAYYRGLLDTNTNGTISTAELEALRFNSTAGNPGGQVNVYRIDQVQAAPLSFVTKGRVFFLQDSWNIDEHWTANAGVRAEEWAHYASDGSNIFTFDYTYAPRLSVVYDIFGDGASKVWAYGGRYYDPIRTDMTQFAGTLSGSVRDEQIFIGNRWLTFRTRGGAQVQDGFFAPTTETPYTDEIMLGYEQTLAENMSVQVTYTDRVTKDIMEDYDLGFYTDPAAVGGYALPLSYFGFTTLPAANYFLATLAGGEREYKGIEVTLRKRKSYDDNWQGMVSYSYNDAAGNTNSDGNADLQGDFLYLDPRAPNVWGNQPGNIEHLVKIFGSYEFANGIEVGAFYNWNSGLAYSRTFSQYGRHTPVRVATAYASNGTTSRWLAPDTVGTNTTDSYGTFDVRVSYDLEFGKYTTELFLDIFNLLDDQAVTREQELSAGDGVYAYQQGSAWVSPRRFYLGARMSF